MKMNLKWLSDPTVYQVNRLPAVSSHRIYADTEEMQNMKSSYIHSLNGTWKFHYANSLEECITGFENSDYDTSCWDTIQVPGHIQLQGYGTPMYVNQVYPWSGSEELIPPSIPKSNPVGSYVTFFDSSILKSDTRTRIIFHGAESGLAVWVNGHFTGYSEDSFTPSSFDITEYLVEGRNKIAVNVYRFTSGSWLEDQDFWRFSGIFRDVELWSIPSVHVEDIKITQNTENLASVHVHVDMQITGNEYSVNLVLKDAENHAIETKKIQTTSTEFVLEHPILWYAERPYLYTLEVHVFKENACVECFTQKIGIRSFEMKDGIMCINGQRIVFHGVNRHEFCCESGRVVSYALTKKDILTMKQNNINTIRTSHYPNQTFLYDLCDEYGMYVIDEVNMETHGTWSEMYDPEHIVPDNKPEWQKAIIDRAASMYERDKNHPSILIWSCGNESHGGKDIYEMSQFLRKKDPSRLIHYEGISHDQRYPDTSDMVSQMYTPASEVEEYLKTHTDKPFFLCEYAHSMGNSNGAIYKYTNLEKKYPLYQGGCIWDYADQALLKDGRFYYGGDFGERPSDYDFCGNGIVFADRTPTPKMEEVRYCYQQIHTTFDKLTMHIENDYLVLNLDSFITRYVLYRNGLEVNRKETVLSCNPQSSIDVEIPFTIKDDAEYTILVSFIKDGIELAHDQVIYPYMAEQMHSTLSLSINEDYLNIGVVCENAQCIFSKVKGLVSYKVNGKEFVRVPVRPNFFRASTNNDVENGYGFRYGQWLQNSLYAKCVYRKVEKKASRCKVYYDYLLPDDTEHPLSVVYTVYSDGMIDIDMEYTREPSQIEMPCFGILFETYDDFNIVHYYGNGPEENYIDRKKGAILKQHSYLVKDNLTPYLYPQECGNRTECRFCTVSSTHHEITFTGDAFECSVLPYTPFVLENAKHRWELPEPYETVIMLNAKQMGIAGDNTWGAKTHPEFLLNDLHQKFHISMKAK